jgi:hypothetical protein
MPLTLPLRGGPFCRLFCPGPLWGRLSAGPFGPCPAPAESAARQIVNQGPCQDQATFRKPLHVKWAEAGEHYGVREAAFWEPVNFRMRRDTGLTASGGGKVRFYGSRLPIQVDG